jgi:hypothetical protein
MATRCINKNLSEFTDVAEALGSPIRANSLITAWQDVNKTEALPTVAEAMQFEKSQKAFYNLKTREFTESLYGNLVRLGILTKFKNDYYVVSSRNRVYDPSVRQFNLNRLYNYLRINNIPKEAISRKAKGAGLSINIERNVFAPNDIITASRGFNTPHSREVVRHLMRMFPQVSVVMLSASDAKILHDDLPASQKSKVPFDKVRSFYVDGKAVLIKGRVTDDVAIEEILHPFVDSLYADNNELFANLLKEARKNFPELTQEIEDAYTDRRGFSKKHRELELVTQALTRHFGKEFAENESKPFKDAVKEFLTWFMDIIKNLSEYLTGKVFSARSISSKATMTDIAKLLNTSDIQFKIEKVADRKVRYNLTDGAKVAYDAAIGASNPLQREIIENIFHAAVHSPKNVGSLAASSLKDGDPILVLDEDTHTYQDLNNLTRPWLSSTGAISGKMPKEAEEKYKLNLDLGNDFDSILNSLAAGLTKKEAMAGMTVLSEDQAGSVYDVLIEKLYGEETGLLRDGSVAIPQVVVYDEATGIAGTIDLLIVKPDGTLKIVDLKTSKDGLKDYAGISRKGKLKYDKDWEVKESLLIEKGFPNLRLSKRQQHNLQVNMYRRMLENMGYTMSSDDNATSTMHIKVDIKGKEQDQKFKGTFKFEEYVVHPVGQNKPYVDALIPSNVNLSKKEKIDETMEESTTSQFNVSDLTKDEAMPDTGIEVDPEYSVITQALRSYQQGLINKQEALNQVNKQMFLGRHKTTGQLQEQVLNGISAINIALGSGPAARSRIFSSLMRDAIRQIEEFKTYVEDPKNFGKPEYISYVLNFDRFMTTFQGLYVLRDSAELNSTQKSLVLTLQVKANDLMGVGNFDTYQEGVIDKAIQDYVRTIVKNTSKKNFSEKELDDLLQMGQDITSTSYNTRDLATSKDTLLALMDKIYKAKQQELLDKIQNREVMIKAAALKLQKISPEKDPQKMYEFMLEFDKDGTFSGRYVQELGPQYYNLIKELRKDLYDAQGNPKQYKDITDLNSASLDDIEYNIALAKAKEKFGNFFRAETIGLNDQPTDGKYHYYTDEFKKERAKYQYFVAGGKNGYWVRKQGTSQRQYERFMAKYFVTNLEQDGRTTAARDKNGNFTGTINKNVIFPIVRSEYKKVRTDQPIKDATGKVIHENLKSAKYNAIMTDDSALGVARREFYQMYQRVFEKELLTMMPKSTRDKMLGRVPTIRGRITQDLRMKPNLVTKLFAKSSKGIKNLFRTTIQQRTVFADEKGDLVDSLPIFYTGNPRTDEQLEAIDLEIQALKQDRADGKIKFDPYEEQLAVLQGTRSKLEDAPTKGELNMDMGNGLLKFASMAEHYETMGSAEDTMKALMFQLEKRKYKSSDTKLRQGVRSKLGFEVKPTIKGSDSNILRRAKKWMNMVYYDNDQMTKGMWEKVSDGLIKLSSLSYVAFNPFGNFNNYVLGRINDNIEAIGGRFYSKEAYAKAVLEYNKRALPGLMHRLGSISGKLKNRGDYDPEKATNKYEAFVDGFRMMDSHSEIRESGSEIDRVGKSYFKRFMDFGYVMQDAAEWNVQTKVGMALVMDTYIRNDDTGEILSLYEAMDFDSETKGLKLKNGFKTIVKVDNKNLDDEGNPSILREMGEYNDQFRYQLRNEIREVNKQIHGNYAHEDRMVLQSSTVGKLGAQFHKWVGPAIRARFDSEYFDENLGWMEGRYRSFWRFMDYSRKQIAQGNMKFNEYSVGFLEDNGYLKDGDIEDNQKAINRIQGFYRTMGEIGIMMLTFAIKEIMQSMWADDDDDSEIMHKFKNIAMYQADRTFKELILFVPLLGSDQQYQMIKSPIASSRTMGELGQALMSTVITPYYAITQDGNEFYANTDVVYQRGSRKGMLKLSKEWKDVIPILYSIKKWQNYADMKNFFIK